MAATKSGWSVNQVSGVEVSGGLPTTGVDMMLYAVAEYQHCESPNVAIPDNSTVGVTETLTFPESLVMGDVEVYVRIKHTFVGDLTMTLTSPEGTVVRLHNRTGGGADSLVGWYDSTLVGERTRYALGDFIGEDAVGRVAAVGERPGVVRPWDAEELVREGVWWCADGC